MTTVGRWSPNKVRARVLDGTWVSPPEELGGMVLLKPTSIAYTGTSASIGANGSVTFTAVSSLSLNGVFDATYDNYMVAIRHSSASSPGGVRVRLRASGTDNTTASSYTWQYLYADSTTVSGARATTDYSTPIPGSDNLKSASTLYFYGPYLSQPTAYRSVTMSGYAGAEIYDVAVTHNQSTAYDGFTVYPNASDLTGLVSVYGLVGA